MDESGLLTRTDLHTTLREFKITFIGLATLNALGIVALTLPLLQLLA